MITKLCIKKREWFMLGHIFLFVIAICHTIYSGFVAGTLVKVPMGYKTIETIQVGDLVCTIKGQASEVVGAISYYCPEVLRIVLKETYIDTISRQKLYTFPQLTWAKTEVLSTLDSLCSNKYGVSEACIYDIQRIKKETQFFDIRLKEHHAFYVTKQEILVHNFPFFSFFYCTPVMYEGVYAGLCCAGIWLSAKLLKLRKAKALAVKDQQSSHRKNILGKKKKKMSMNDFRDQLLQKKYALAATGGDDPDPDDEEDMEKKFLESIIDNSIKDAYHKRFGRFYKDPKTNLWWAKDKGGSLGHSGPHYKVFKESAKGLDWVFDADLVGRKILGKHKGPIGLYIPYKELIFIS